MLKTRIIGTVLVKEGIVVQSIGFKKYLPVGMPEIAIHYLDSWGVDEIVVLHIDATLSKKPISAEKVKSYAKQCQVPLTIGGGITELNQIKEIIRAGADKVVINSGLMTHPGIITQASDLFGQQSIVVSIDAYRTPEGIFQAFTQNGKIPTGLTPHELARKAQQLGAGEIFLTSMNQDGSKRGFDLDLLRSVIDQITIPLIFSGGAGHPEHIKQAIENGASAVAVGNAFHFTEHSVVLTKRYLKEKLMPIRLEGAVTYEAFNLDQSGRILKQADQVLDFLRFQYIPEEEI